MNKTNRQFQTIFGVVALTVLGVSLGASPAHAQAQTQSGADRVSVTLSDPARPGLVKAGLIDGGITVKSYDGREVIVEARARNRESARSDDGPKRLSIASTGLTVEEENNQVNVNTESYARPIDLTITVPVHTSLTLRAVTSPAL